MLISRWCCRWASEALGRPLLCLLLVLGGCASTPPQIDKTDALLGLINRVIEASSAEERRGLEEDERNRFDSVPTYDNMLRLALVRAFSAALPAELMETRNDLLALAEGRQELTDNQRYLAKMALIMVDQRLQMGAQITDLQRQIDSLQRQIDSLTAIEASLKDNDVNRPPEPQP
ncbi:MAG TPA: hypothetical protein VF210_07985 [Pseudomonadales bacterium]